MSAAAKDREVNLCDGGRLHEDKRRNVWATNKSCVAFLAATRDKR
jgi:hypothetical protein